MKKIIAGILAAVTILSVGSVAYATGGPAMKANSQKLDSSAIAKNHVIREDVLIARKAIIANEAQINKLRRDINVAMAQVRQKIAALKEDDATVTQDQIDAIKAAVASIKTERNAFKTAHKDVIKNIYPALRDARKAKDFDTMKAQFDTIIAEQQSRIADLQKVLDSTNSILTV